MAKRNLQLDKLPSNNLTTPNKETPIVTGGVKRRKGGGLARDIRNIGNSLFGELILPALKSMALDFLNEAGSQVLFRGENAPRKGKPRAYDKLYRTRPKTTHGRKKPQTRYVEEIEEVFDNVFYEHREDANRVLGRMMERVAEYGFVTIGDLESLSGLATNYTHEDWGWDDLSGTRVRFNREGYVIDFPEPIYLD